MKYSIDEVYKIRFIPPPFMEEAESPVVEEAPAVDTAGIPQEALEDKARQLGVSVSDLTPDQIEEVRASLATEEPAPKARGGRRKAKSEK